MHVVFVVTTTTYPCRRRHRTHRRRRLTKFDSWFVNLTVVLDSSSFWTWATRQTWRWTIKHHHPLVVVVFKSDVSIVTPVSEHIITVWSDRFLQNGIPPTSLNKVCLAFFLFLRIVLDTCVETTTTTRRRTCRQDNETSVVGHQSSAITVLLCTTNVFRYVY